MNWQHQIYSKIDYMGLTPWRPIGYLIKGPLYKNQLFLWHAKNRNDQHFYIVAKSTGTLNDETFLDFVIRDNYKKYCDGDKVPVSHFGHTTLITFLDDPCRETKYPDLKPSILTPTGPRRHEPHTLYPKYNDDLPGWYRPLKDEPKYHLPLETARTKYDLRKSYTYPVAFTDFER